MNSLLVSVVGLLAVVAVGTALSLPSGSGTFGVVENVQDCGSAGELQAVFVTNCTLAPCNFSPGSSYLVQVVFIASANARQLTLHIKALLEVGDYVEIGSVPVEGSIVGGEQFTISFNLPVTSIFAGQSMVIWFELIDEMDGRMEICATASAHVDNGKTQIQAVLSKV